jgi:hypothetical protein
VRSTIPALLAVGSTFAILAVAAPARADVSGWAFIGGGALAWKQGEASTMTPFNDGTFGANGTMTIEAGVGTTPEARFIFGGLFRLQPIFKHGTDLAWLLRGASHGFQAGDWGVAVDAGAYLRTWGPQIGGGFAGGVSLGMPLGFTLSVQTEVGTNKALSVGAVAGVDLLRLSVYRETLLKWWQNPSPAWTRSKSAASGTAIAF